MPLVENIREAVGMRVVPLVRLERTLPKEPDFESGASANSATGALRTGKGRYVGCFGARVKGQEISFEKGRAGGMVFIVIMGLAMNGRRRNYAFNS